jgi:hypothetical protein
MRARILPLLLLATSAIHAQTHFYMDQIAVVPGNPTTSDNVSIHLIGNLSDGGAYIASAEATVTGGMVVLDVVAESNGGITVLIPHTEVIMLGQLPAGDYEITLGAGSSAVWDMALEEEHFFTVTGSGGDPCDDLTLVSVHWQAFADTALIVHVLNSGPVGFDYPNFILFNEQGDTLARETVNFFGIANESWHVMRILDGVVLPDVPFNGRLELWTFFTDSLVCTWDQSFDLCPPAPCASLSPTLVNLSGALVTGSFQWGVYDDADIVAQGFFELTPTVQSTDTTLCLPPGNYHLNVSPLDPGFIGILQYYAGAPGGQATATMPVTASLPVLLPFTFYGPCIPGSQSITEYAPSALITAPRAGGMLVQHPDAEPLGPVWLFDVQGRLLFSTTANTDRLFVPMDKPGVYVLRAGDRTVKVLGGME